MGIANNKNIILCISPHIPIQKGLNFAFQQFPYADFTLIAEAGRKIPKEYEGKIKVLSSNSRRTPKDIIVLLKGLRKARYDIAVCIGNFLPYLWFAAFTGAEKKCFFKDIKNEEEIRDIIRISLIGRMTFALLFWLGTLPLVLFLLIIFVIEGFLSRNIQKQQQGDVPQVDNSSLPVSIVIPNYNGKDLLSECLPSVVGALSKVAPGCEIIVVDDGSKDNSVEFLAKEFPEVRVIPLTVNQGFGKACNIGVSSAKNRICVLLNSDVMVKEGFLQGLTQHFTDSKVFAVQPKILAWDGKTLNGGLNFIKIVYGHFTIENESARPMLRHVDMPVDTLYAIGGAMAFDRIKWEMLRGLDAMYAPFCWEDIDVCYMALKRGWKVLYEPRSEVIHKHHATLSKVFKPSYKKQIEYRNELLFTWKNLDETANVIKHFLLLPLHISYHLFVKNDPTFALSLWKATAKLIAVLKRRVYEKKHAIVNNEDIMRKVVNSYRYWHRKHRTRPNILVLTPFMPFPPSDGGRLRVYNLLKHLSAKYDFHLLSFIEDIDEARYLPELKKICRDVELVLRKEGHKSSLNLLKDLFHLPVQYVGTNTNLMKDKLKDIIELYQPDIIQIEFSQMSPYIPLCKELKTIFVEHDISIITSNSYHSPPRNKWKKIVDYIDRRYRILHWEKKIGKSVNCIIAVTDIDRQILRKSLPEARIEVVSTGTDIEYFLREYKEVSNKDIVFVGSMGHFPNVDAALYFYTEIFPKIRKESPDATFTVVGSGKHPEVSALAEDPNVRVTGYVEDVRPYIENTEVFVAPMRKGAGIKGKILEAMAMSKPIVATSVGVQGIAIEPEKEFLPADDPEQFARQILRLFRSPVLKRNLAVSANRVCRERYEWRTKAEEMEKIYESLLERAV